MFWQKRTMIDMQCGSSGRTMGKAWRCSVQYDAFGSPYGKAHDGSPLRLNKDGTTYDTRMYGTIWERRSGPVVTFPTPTHRSKGE